MWNGSVEKKLALGSPLHKDNLYERPKSSLGSTDAKHRGDFGKLSDRLQGLTLQEIQRMPKR